jgi:hypothetical protein
MNDIELRFSIEWDRCMVEKKEEPTEVVQARERIPE